MSLIAFSTSRQTHRLLSPPSPRLKSGFFSCPAGFAFITCQPIGDEFLVIIEMTFTNPKHPSNTALSDFHNQAYSSIYE